MIFLYQNDHHIVLVMYTEFFLAKHHFSKYNKVLLQKKILVLVFLKPDTNLHMFIHRL